MRSTQCEYDQRPHALLVRQLVKVYAGVLGQRDRPENEPPAIPRVAHKGVPGFHIFKTTNGRAVPYGNDRIQ